MNYLLNGDFSCWPFGESFTITSHLQRVAARWNWDWDYNGTIGKTLIQRVRNVCVDSFGTMFSNAIRITNLGGAANNIFQDLSTQVESVHNLSGKQVTLSFYAFSASENSTMLLQTEQYFGHGGAPSPPVFNEAKVTVAQNKWGRYSATFDLLPTTGQNLGTDGDCTLNAILTLPLNVPFDMYITGVKLELGGKPSAFDFQCEADTAARCERYVQSSYDDGVTPGAITNRGAFFYTPSVPNPIINIPLRTAMRVPPSSRFYSPVTGAVGKWFSGTGQDIEATVYTAGTKNISVALSGASPGTPVCGHYLLQDPYY